MSKDKPKSSLDRVNRHIEKMKALGYKQKVFWLTDDQHEVVKSFVDDLKQPKD